MSNHARFTRIKNCDNSDLPRKTHAMLYSRVFQKFVPIVNCILHKAFNASLGKCKLIEVRNLSK